MPDADAYAAALVAACRSTGERPEDFALRDPEFKARHYAFHALLAVFPGADRGAVAEALRCPGKAAYFYRSSCWRVLGEGPHRSGPIEWWNAAAFERTMMAAALTTRDVRRPAPPPKTLPQRRVEPPPQSQSRLSHSQRFVEPAGRRRSAEEDALDRRATERRESRDILAEAAANTARLQAQLPPEESEDEGGE